MGESLGRHLRRRDEDGSGEDWRNLYAEALRRARENDDPRVAFLESRSDDPETALRRLSILDSADLDREFG